MRSNVVVPAGLRDALLLLEELKVRLVSSPGVCKPPPTHPRLAAHNEFYYIMEGYEARFMLAFMRELVRNDFPQSIVFRCDGLYLMPPCSAATASHCADIAGRQVGIEGLQVKYSCLRAARAEALTQLYAQIGPTTPANPPSFFTKFCQNEWWENLHVPRPRAQAGPAEQRKRAHVHIDTHIEDQHTLLRFIKRRKLAPVSSSP